MSTMEITASPMSYFDFVFLVSGRHNSTSNHLDLNQGQRLLSDAHKPPLQTATADVYDVTAQLRGSPMLILDKHSSCSYSLLAAPSVIARYPPAGPESGRAAFE